MERTATTRGGWRFDSREHGHSFFVDHEPRVPTSADHTSTALELLRGVIERHDYARPIGPPQVHETGARTIAWVEYRWLAHDPGLVLAYLARGRWLVRLDAERVIWVGGWWLEGGRREAGAAWSDLLSELGIEV